MVLKKCNSSDIMKEMINCKTRNIQKWKCNRKYIPSLTVPEVDMTLDYIWKMYLASSSAQHLLMCMLKGKKVQHQRNLNDLISLWHWIIYLFVELQLLQECSLTIGLICVCLMLLAIDGISLELNGTQSQELYRQELKHTVSKPLFISFLNNYCVIWCHSRSCRTMSWIWKVSVMITWLSWSFITLYIQTQHAQLEMKSRRWNI